jgi:hypothetical protein
VLGGRTVEGTTRNGEATPGKAAATAERGPGSSCGITSSPTVKFPVASVCAVAFPGGPSHDTTTSLFGGKPVPVTVVTNPAGPRGGLRLSTGAPGGALGPDGPVGTFGTVAGDPGAVEAVDVAVVGLVVGEEVVVVLVLVVVVLAVVVVAVTRHTGAGKLTS